MQRLQIYQIASDNWVARLSRGSSPESAAAWTGEYEDRRAAVEWARSYSQALACDAHEQTIWSAMADQAADEIGSSDIIVGGWGGRSVSPGRSLVGG